jgi:hypothetical protein
MLGFKERASHQFDLIIHVCPIIAPLGCFVIGVNLRRVYAFYVIIIRLAIRLKSGLQPVSTDPQLATWTTSIGLDPEGRIKA